MKVSSTLCAFLLLVCSATTARAAQLQDLRLPFDGGLRRYLLYVPDSLASRPSVVLSLHGGGGGGADAAAMERVSRYWQTIADREGFLVVYPEGVLVEDQGAMWNDCRSGLTGAQSNANDVGFLRRLIQFLVITYRANPARVFVQGQSNGGMMAYRLAAESPGELAGIAPIVANEPEDPAQECQQPTAPLSRINLLVMNGTADVLMPFNGGTVALSPEQGQVISTADTIERWRAVNGCAVEPTLDLLPDVDSMDGSRVRREEWPNCQAGVRLQLYRVIGGGHSMPSLTILTDGPTASQNRDIESVEVIWSFFNTSVSAERLFANGFEELPGGSPAQ